MPAADISQESGFWLATAPATALQRRLTLAAMAVLFVLFVPSVLFANLVVAQSDGFIPFIQSMMFVTELATAVLLYTQFAALCSRAILVLASGYLFSALIVMAHTLVFPRALLPDGFLSAGLQTPAWLYVIWHFVFPASVIGYALLKDEKAESAGPAPSSTQPVVFWSVTTVCGLAFAVTWLLIAADAYVPRILLDKTTFSSLAGLSALFESLVCLVAFVLLWKRQHSFLDRWLLIAVLATMLEMTILGMMTGRFSIGWYTARLFGVVASAVVLVALLIETMMLYARLASALVLVRRERAHRLMSLDAATSAMAHELRQPLTAVAASGEAALNWLDRTPPNLKEVRTCLASIVSSGQRADDVISAVRELFKTKHDHRTLIRIDDIALQTLSLIKQDLEASKIVVKTKFEDGLPEIHADRTQLQQVILNLVRNAIDAMDSTSPGGRRLKLSASVEGSRTVVLSVEDSGPGIVIKEADRVFDPFFTTKSAGIGLGLAISQTIVEDHGGTLRLAKTDTDGSVFEIALPVAATNPSGVRM